MDVVTVTPSALRTAADALSEAARGIHDELERLGDAADLLRLSWEGDAQTAFDRSQTRLRATMERHGTQLIAIAKAVDQLAGKYGEADRKAARGLGGQ